MSERTYVWSELEATGLPAKYHLTYRKLDYWCRAGYLGQDLKTRPGSGVNRNLTWSQFQQACTIAALTLAGFNVDRAVYIAGGLSVFDVGQVTYAGKPELGLSVRVGFDPPEEPHAD